MTWPAYSEYRESAIPGVREIPTEWSPVRMDKHLRYVKKPVSPETLVDVEVFHYSIPVVQATGTGAVEDGSTIDSNKFTIDQELLLVSKLNPRKATVCLAVPDGRLTVCSTEFVPLASLDLDMGFARYVVTSEPYRQRLESLVESATRSHQRVNPSEVYRFWWAIPSVTVQRKVAAFLDRETARIDAVIGKQEQLIATLREDRTATITHAVTKGLNPDVNMRDSGVRWLGEVPAHWAVHRIKHSVESARNGIWGSDPDGGIEDIRCVRVADFDRPRLTIHDRDVTFRKVTASERKNRVLHRGDLLLEKSGGGDKNPVGFVALYDSDEPAVCSNFVARVELSPGQHPKFWTYVHHCLYSSRLTYPSIKQNTGIQNLDQQSYFNERAGFPPMKEQSEIVTFLDERCERIDALIAKADAVIDTLREYRSALITDAVTGKIDVRGAA